DFATLKQLLEDLFAQDALATTRLIEAVRWELPSELAEVAWRWRQGRLRDLGFPSLEGAGSFYARPARRGQPAGAGEPAAGAAIALSPAAAPLLDRALALVPAEAYARVEEGVIYAANAALVANAVAADDLLGARATLADARSTLSLGLDVL